MDDKIKNLAVRGKPYDEKKLEFFSPSEKIDIQKAARGMSTGEALDIWAVGFDELSNHDKAFFQHNYRIGRSGGKAVAIDSLFRQMNIPRIGKDACMAYLLRFAESWPDDVEDKAAGKVYKLMIE